MFLYVGNRDLFGKGGISIFRYNENEAALEYLGTQHTDISAGFLAVDHENAYLFCVNEQMECRGVPGGQVLCLRIDPRTGDLKVLSRANTHTVLPCYVHYISDTRRLLVCNHAKRDWTLKIGLTDEGALCGQKVYDDAALEVFDVTQDGIITGPASYWAAPHVSHASDNPHLHSITYDAQDRQFFVCDTGSDVIYTLALDDRGSPLLTSIADPNGEASAPRYGVLHPTLPIAYFNSEKQNALFVFRISECKLISMQVVSVLDVDNSSLEPIMQSAILINHSGNVLYTLARKSQSISAFAIAENGSLSFLQTYSIGIEGPRAMVITPDDGYIFVACSKGKAVVQIQVDSDGSLKSHTLEKTPLLFPSSLAIFNP